MWCSTIGVMVILTLSVLVGAISMARAVDDPDLSQQIRTNAAAALTGRIPNQGPELDANAVSTTSRPTPHV